MKTLRQVFASLTESFPVTCSSMSAVHLAVCYAMSVWLEKFSIGELWEKNVLGGHGGDPHSGHLCRLSALRCLVDAPGNIGGTS